MIHQAVEDHHARIIRTLLYEIGPSTQDAADSKGFHAERARAAGAEIFLGPDEN
jgi:hypothetical protein